MGKRKGWIVMALMAVSLNGSAQQILSSDVAGDKEYAKVCREYDLKSDNRVELLEDYLKRYPDSRHTNRVKSMIASVYFDEGKLEEAIDIYGQCNLDNLADKERDESVCKMATAYLKLGNVQEAKIWFNLLKDMSKTHASDAVFNLGYIDYTEKKYDEALDAFMSLKNDKVYASLIPYYIGEIYLLRGDNAKAEEVSTAYLANFSGHKDEAEMLRIQGESRYGQENYLGASASLKSYVERTSAPQRKALYKLGMSHYHTEAFTDAVSSLGKVTSVDDALAQNAYLHMGLAYLNLRERNQARMSFEQASLSSHDLGVKEQALYNYALCLHETSYSPFAESVTVFERFLNEFPSSSYAEQVNDYLVEVYMNTRSYEAALQSIAKIQRPGARIMEAKQKILFHLGTQAFANAKMDQAIGYFNESLGIGQYNASTKADAFYWRGEANYRIGNYGGAYNDFRQHLNLATDKSSQEYGLALYNLGYTQFKRNNYNDALNWFVKYVNQADESEKQIMADAYNRIGDCQFYVRGFDEARQSYAKALQLEPGLGDYSLYQEGFVKGVQRDYMGKIQSLNELITKFPQSQYIDDALYEQGRAFIMMEDNANAIGRYQILVKNYPESRNARRAANEIGLLYYQDDKYPEAIAAYKEVIQNYPGSEEARMAQRDLKSLYLDLNKVDEYAEFASSLPGGVTFDVNERDSLTYVAAERVYMRGEIEEARNSFMRYLQSFPEGAFNLDANYYLGLMEYNTQKYAEAVSYLDKVMAFPNNKYSVEAMRMTAESSYLLKDYAKSLDIYKRLKDLAETPEQRQQAETGALRSAVMLNNNEEVVHAATTILADAKVMPELANEARYYRAKALTEVGEKALALEDWKVLSADPRNVYGAEAKYRLAQALYDSGAYDKVENEVFEFVDAGTPHAYWLARSFVLISDAYSKLGRGMEARQYLLSLKENYQADDDIAGMIKERLERLDKENVE